jgi:hypothetical protein
MSVLQAQQSPTACALPCQDENRAGCGAMKRLWDAAQLASRRGRQGGPSDCLGSGSHSGSIVYAHLLPLVRSALYHGLCAPSSSKTSVWADCRSPKLVFSTAASCSRVLASDGGLWQLQTMRCQRQAPERDSCSLASLVARSALTGRDTTSATKTRGDMFKLPPDAVLLVLVLVREHGRQSTLQVCGIGASAERWAQPRNKQRSRQCRAPILQLAQIMIPKPTRDPSRNGNHRPNFNPTPIQRRALTSPGSLLAASCAWRAFSRSCCARSARRSASAASWLASRACTLA